MRWLKILLFQKKKIIINTKSSLHNGDGRINLIDVPILNRVLPGKLDKSNSIAQLRSIEFAVNECMKKNYDALVTLPLNKKILSFKGKKFGLSP